MGVIGIGRMGRPICSALVESGFGVIASDLRAERARDVRSVGARWETEQTFLVARADVLITVLLGSRELRAFSESAWARLRSGMTWIDMTSASPTIGRHIAARADARGVACLDAPLGGSPKDIGTRALRLFAGGAQRTLERHRLRVSACSPAASIVESRGCTWSPKQSQALRQSPSKGIVRQRSRGAFPSDSERRWFGRTRLASCIEAGLWIPVSPTICPSRTKGRPADWRA